MEFATAWRALQALIANPEDTEQVFIIMQALTGKSLFKQYERFLTLKTGQKVLSEKRDLLTTLADREALKKLPEGTLGKTYIDFMINEGISAEGLVEASEETYTDFADKDLERYTMRTREMHDLWHVITGYGRDGLGEVCVVSFSYAQTKSLGFAAISLMGAYHFSKMFPRRGIFDAAWQAYWIGRKAKWFPGQDWEHLLTLPLEDVRRLLNVKVPTKYLALNDISQQTRPAPMEQLAEQQVAAE
jgi:ubiquinone biosynthesis protein COQ4